MLVIPALVLQFPGAPKVLSGALTCFQTYHNHFHGTPLPVISDPSYSQGQPECPPRVRYSAEIDASEFTLHILSDAPGGSQWLKYILLMLLSPSLLCLYLCLPPTGCPLPIWMAVVVRTRFCRQNGLQMHLYVLPIGVSRCFSISAWVPSAARSTTCIYRVKLQLILPAILWCTYSCDCNTGKYDKQNALWLWNSKNYCGENTAQSLPQSGLMLRRVVNYSQRSPQTYPEVSAGLEFDYHVSQISEHPDCTSITAGHFRSTTECSCIVWEHFA